MVNVYETTLPSPVLLKHAVGDRGQQTTVPSRHGFKRSNIGTLCGPVNLGARHRATLQGVLGSPRMASNIQMSYVKKRWVLDVSKKININHKSMTLD